MHLGYYWLMIRYLLLEDAKHANCKETTFMPQQSNYIAWQLYGHFVLGPSITMILSTRHLEPTSGSTVECYIKWVEAKPLSELAGQL